MFPMYYISVLQTGKAQVSERIASTRTVPREIIRQPFNPRTLLSNTRT